MKFAASQAYLHTRVSGMATRLFRPDTLALLAERRAEELAAEYDLTAALESQLPVKARSRAVEQALINTLLAELRILIRPMAAPERTLILDWGRHYALANLKTLIRGKLHDLDRKVIADNLYELPHNLRLPMQDSLFQAENVLELLRQLEGGPYSFIARQARVVFERKQEPFALEAAIDQRYLTGLVRDMALFADRHCPCLRRLIGALLDRLAILWLLRFRFSYQLSSSETFFQLVPSVRRLHRERLLALVNLDSFAAVLAALPPPFTGLLAESHDLMDVQRRLNAYLRDEALDVIHAGQTGVARALAYLILREQDLMALFSLIQGRLLELPAEVIKVAIETSSARCHLGERQAA
jgi:V/A-type H+-transporting ATPase subunit C